MKSKKMRYCNIYDCANNLGTNDEEVLMFTWVYAISIFCVSQWMHLPVFGSIHSWERSWPLLWRTVVIHPLLSGRNNINRLRSRYNDEFHGFDSMCRSKWSVLLWYGPTVSAFASQCSVLNLTLFAHTLTLHLKCKLCIWHTIGSDFSRLTLRPLAMKLASNVVWWFSNCTLWVFRTLVICCSLQHILNVEQIFSETENECNTLLISCFCFFRFQRPLTVPQSRASTEMVALHRKSPTTRRQP